MMKRKVLIHIGKCGGSTCRQALAGGAVPFDEIVHIRKPPIGPDIGYVIVARDPIERALSAFNWRYRLVVTEARQKARFRGEYPILLRYRTLNEIAEGLYTPQVQPVPVVQRHFRAIHQLKQDIAFYLADLLANVGPEQIAGVVMQESLSEDLQALFGIRTELRANRNRHTIAAEELALSPRARANLRRFLEADYRCLGILRDWGKINPRALEVLSF